MEYMIACNVQKVTKYVQRTPYEEMIRMRAESNSSGNGNNERPPVDLLTRLEGKFVINKFSIITNFEIFSMRTWHNFKHVQINNYTHKFGSHFSVKKIKKRKKQKKQNVQKINRCTRIEIL